MTVHHRNHGTGASPQKRSPVGDLARFLPQVPDLPARVAALPPLPGPMTGTAPGKGRKVSPRALPVAGLSRDIRVKIASERAEWKDAFQLVASNYQACGYEVADAGAVRFTPYHALPDTVTFVAKHEGNVLMTMSLVPDNTRLGLPLEAIFGEEVRALRRQRRRMGEVISLAAAKELGMREFHRVFVALIRLMKQYHVSHGGDTWVITVNPKHRDFYTKALGYVPVGPSRPYGAVQGAPAEAYLVDMPLLKAGAPKMYQQLFAEWLPGDALVAPRMLPHMVRYLGGQSSKDSQQKIREVFDLDHFFSSPRRW
jgi:hypothetical protein